MKFKRLSEIGKITMGQSPNSSSYNEERRGIPFYQGNADFGEKYPSERVWCEEPKKIAYPEDILISVRAPIGALNYARTECCIGRGLAAIRIEDEFLRNYVFHLLKARNGELNRKGTGSTFKAIGKNVLEEILVPVIDRGEQECAMRIMDNLEETIRRKKLQMELLDNLVKARFVELFGDPSLNTKGYPVKSLPEIADYWNGLTYKPEDVADEGTIVLRSSNIQNAQLDFEDTVRVTCRIGEKKYVQENDILMCSRNGSARLVGKVALIKNINEPMSFGAFMMIIRSQYYPYLMTYFQMPAFRAQITTGATTTINQITGRMLDNVKLPVPGKTELESFISFIEQVDKSKAAVQKSLDETQVLFDSLIQKYFG